MDVSYLHLDISVGSFELAHQRSESSDSSRRTACEMKAWTCLLGDMLVLEGSFKRLWLVSDLVGVEERGTPTR